MDPFAHFQEIKLLVTMALGYFCYRRLSASSHAPACWDISDDQSVQESPMQEEPPLPESSLSQNCAEIRQQDEEIPLSLQNGDQDEPLSESGDRSKHHLDTEDLMKREPLVTRRYIPKSRRVHRKPNQKTKKIVKSKPQKQVLA